MSKALIIYSTRSGQTRIIGELIAEGLRIKGIDVTIVDVKNIKNEADLSNYDAYLLGSATYHGDMMKPMKTFLFMAEKADLEGKTGGSFGAFGWSGEAPERIYDTMKNIYKMDMVSSPLMLKSGKLEGGIEMAHDYGRDIAKKMGI